MKKIFTLALAAAAVVGASASPLSVKNVTPQAKFKELNTVTPIAPKATSMVSRANELPDPKTGDFVFMTDYEIYQNGQVLGIYTLQPYEASITKDGDKYMLDLGLSEFFGMEAQPVELTKVALQSSDGTSQDFWGIATDGSAVVFKDMELKLQDGSSVTADVYVGGCSVAADQSGQGAYAYVGGSKEAAVAFTISEDGALLEQVQYNWNGLEYPITGILLLAEMKGEVGLVDYIFEPVYFQPNATYSTTMELEDGDETLNGGCYVTPFSSQTLGSGYLAYGVGEQIGALPSVVDGKTVKSVLNPACFVQGYQCFWGDLMNQSDNYAAEGTFAENGDAKTITYPEIGIFASIGQEVAFFKDTTITFGGTGAINDVAVDNNNAPVEYFNLQGVRVNEPVAGQIVIRRQGNEVSKLLVK